ncbi:MAG TPA: EAL domain-containing protein, partial [Candidatus Baltobacteraceae bacterium]|nr:EAL domain-containing protein [Candidatus Baltobacteraceae bacterium]
LFRDHDLVRSEPHLRSFSIVPARGPHGDIVGAVCVLDAQPALPNASGLEELERIAALVGANAANALASANSLTIRTPRQGIVAQALTRSVAREGFQVYLQPQVDLQGGQTLGLEVLLRWEDPDLSWVEPSEFIPLAEESGEILAIGYWMLDRCLELAGPWGMQAPFIALNLSTRQFTDPDLISQVLSALNRLNFPPNRLAFEVAASTLIQDFEASKRIISTLRNLGCRMYMDNVAPHSAPSEQIAQLDLDGLKIDQRLLADVGTAYSANGAEGQVNSVLAIAKGLGISACGIGVETDLQLEFLKKSGCTLAQGFHLGRPVPAESLAKAKRSA